MFLYVIPFYKLLPAFPKTLAEAEPISVVGNKVVSGINVLPPENSVASITEASPNIIKDTTLNMSLDWQKWALIIWIVVAGALVLWNVLGLLRFRYQLQQSQTVHNALLQEIAKSLCCRSWDQAKSSFKVALRNTKSNAGWFFYPNYYNPKC